MANNNNSVWTACELIAVLNLYYFLQATHQSMTASNPMIINTANSIGRTVDAIVMRLQNYRFWETDGQEGLSNGGPRAEAFWKNNRWNHIVI